MRIAASVLVCCVTALVALGLVMLYSCGMSEGGAKYLVSQLTWLGIGLVPCALAASVDYRHLRRAAWPLYLLTLVLLVLVFIPPVGLWVKGAWRWVKLGPIRFQPSELAKLALLIVLALYCERFQRQMSCWRRGVLYPMLIIAPILALIFKEPDRGTTILLAGVSCVVLLVAGVRWHYIAIPGIAGLVGLGFSLVHDPMRIKRIFGWLYLEEHKSGVGYQAYQAMLALGAGGWFGVGLGNSKQKLGFVPERHTDFILSIIGEELGATGTLILVAVYIAIVVSGIVISLRASDSFGTLLGSGITFLIGCQAFINIGVVTSALPNKGLPLPFVSYGGSNLLIMLTCVGVLLSIVLHTSPEEALSRSEADENSDRDFAMDNPFSAKPQPAKT